MMRNHIIFANGLCSHHVLCNCRCSTMYIWEALCSQVAIATIKIITKILRLSDLFSILVIYSTCNSFVVVLQSLALLKIQVNWMKWWTFGNMKTYMLSIHAVTFYTLLHPTRCHLRHKRLWRVVMNTRAWMHGVNPSTFWQLVHTFWLKRSFSICDRETIKPRSIRSILVDACGTWMPWSHSCV